MSPARRLPDDAPKLFAAEYIKDFNAACAYERAFKTTTTPGSAKVGACRLMKLPEVQEAIQAAMEARVSRVNVDADRVLLEVARLALSDLRRAFDQDGRLLDPKDWPDELAAAVASVESVESVEEGGKDGKPLAVVRKLRAWDKPAALTLAMRHLGMLVDRKEFSGPNGGPIRQESNVALTPAEAYRAALGG